MATTAYRLLEEAILSANILVVPYGTQEGANAVNASAKPAPPTDSTPGKWVSIGQVSKATLTPENKEVSVEGADSAGMYRTRKMRISIGNTLAFSTPDLSPEALQLAWGLEATINDSSTTSVRPFVTNGTMKVWLFIKVNNAYRNGLNLLHAVITGTLRLQNPINIASDPISVDWELSIEPNELDEFKSANVQHPAGA